MLNRYFISTALSFLILAVSFVYFDLMHGFSFTYWWWDSYEHFLGGIVVGFFVVWALSLVKKTAPLWLVVFFILAVGLAWESIELFYPMGVSPFMSWEADTIKDLILDTAGAILAFYTSKRMRV
jgi:hypothetical protein